MDNLAKAAVMAIWYKPARLLEDAEIIIKGGMRDYEAKQEKIRADQQAKLDAQAKAEEEKERKKLEKKAEKAEAKGDTEKAEDLRDQKEQVAVEAPVVAKRTEAPKGISYRNKYTAEVIDFAKLPDEYKLANMPMLNKTVQAQKGQVPIPGVKFKSEKIVASRAS